MNLSDLNHQAPRYKSRKRVGRGMASGHGKTSGRGHKGAKSRSGYRRRLGFEGGQMPLFRRIPKRGFNNVFKKEYDLVNLGDLERVEADTVDLETLVEQGIVKKRHGRLKVLGNGELTKKLVVKAARFSKSARSRIEELGGEAQAV